MTKKDKPDTDTNTVGKRVKRYARVSKTVGGLAARMAGHKYLGLDLNKPAHAKQLMESLGDLKGPLLKVAQLLATIPNALPKEYALELQKLQSQAPSMGWLFVRRRMQAELGRDWQKKFNVFGKEASAAASLGQVHRAETLKGVEVACKLQYPDMASAVEADLQQLKVFLGVFEKYDRSVMTKNIQQEIADRLYEELDYKREAQNAKLYDYILRDEKDIHVPQIIDDLSTDRLLTATWLDGHSILDYKDASQEIRNAISMRLFRAWYVPLYQYGIIHGDPHLGNYTISPTSHDLNLLDFGCVRVFSPAFVAGVITLYHALQNRDRDMAVSAYESWGFKGLKNETVDILNTWAGFLYGPVLDDRVRPIGVVKEGGEIYGRETASKVHQALRESGGVTIPHEFVFMDRAALGLGSVFLHLKSEVNWHDLFHEMIQGFELKNLEKTQKNALKKFNLFPKA